MTSSKTDRNGRAVGKVMLDGRDIILEQINRGMAWFYRAYARELSRDDAVAYERAENEARASERGLWADASPVEPWNFRRIKTAPKPALVITGGIIGNRNSKIYHLPDCSDYNKVAERNRVPFKTEAEAQAEGYRKARNCPLKAKED